MPCSLNYVVLAALATTTVTGSTNADELAEELTELTIEAARLEKPVSAIPNTVTILDIKDIRQQTAISDDVSSILEKTVPGFGPSLRKLVGRGESFRGRNPLYLIDGVPQHNPLRDGQRDGHTIETDFIEKIEVIHGSNSIQGIGATGGVINLVTKSPRYTDKWSSDAKVALTTHDSFHSDSFLYKVSYTGGIKLDKFDVMGGVAYHKRDLFFDAKGDRVGLYATQGDIMDSGSRNIFFKAGFEPDENQRIQVMLNDFNLEGDGDYVPVAGNRSTGKLGTTADGNPKPTQGDPTENDVSTITLNYKHDNIFSGKLKTQFYYQDFAAKYQGGTFVSKTGKGFYRLTPEGDPYLDQSQIESKKLGVKFMYSLSDIFIDDLNPTIGLDYQRDKTTQSLVKSGRKWVPETVLQGVAPFMQLDYTLFDRLHLTSGFRYEMVGVKIGDYKTIAAYNNTLVKGGEPEFKELLPNIGASFELVQGLKLYTSYTEGFTMPDIGRVTRSIKTPGKSIKTLINLKPVITENIEIGLDYNFSRGSFHADYYWSDSKFGSRLEKNSADIFEVKREKKAIQGFDLAADYDVTSYLTVGANYAHITGRYDSNQDGKVDTDFDGVDIAPNRLNGFVNVEFDNNFNGRLQVSRLFDRDFAGLAAPPKGKADFNGYTVVDLYLGKTIGKGGEISLGIDNLLDRQYITYFSQTERNQKNDTFFAGNGRTFTLIYNHKF